MSTVENTCTEKIRQTCLTALACPCLGALFSTLPALAQPSPCAEAMSLDPRVEIALTIGPGLEARGWRTSFDLGEGLPVKEENHEFDPDPILFRPATEQSVSVLAVSGQGFHGEELKPICVVLLPGKGTPGDKEESHESDPDPLRVTSAPTLWRAWIYFSENAQDDLLIDFRLLHGSPKQKVELEWHDAFLAWTVAWLWPEAYADEGARPHDGRFRLVAYRPLTNSKSDDQIE